VKPVLDTTFVALLDAGPDAMLCVDSGGRITLVNALAESLFGYQREELEGQPVEVLVPDAGRAVHARHRETYTADPKPRPMGARIELSGRRRDGSTFPADISLATIDTDKGMLVIAAVRDMTSRQQALEELEQANRNLESFAYSVSHDLRAPLRALAGFSAALIEDCADGLGETGRDYAERIQAASEQMAKLIDALLQLSRVSRAGLNLQAVDLGAEVAEIAGELQRGSPDRHVRFTIQQPVWALADRDLVRAVLQNLLDNAWKFTSGRDDASIDFAAAPAAEARLCCHVRDNGAGFDPAYAGKLFRPFQRLHSAREFPGTGIGLASVRQIVERHGGRTWAEGAVGEGATFYFTLRTAETI
jgi:PAS domain S-box-containing protein